MASQPLGTRLNNPLNLRATSDVWEGSTGEESGFVSFESPEHGYRAADRVLQTYGTGGVNTISDTISRFAPKTENDTDNYISFVSQKTGVSPSAEIDLGDPQMRRLLLSAMGEMETGTSATPEDIDGMISRAVSRTSSPEATPIDPPALFKEDDNVEGMFNMMNQRPSARANPDKSAFNLTVMAMALDPSLDIKKSFETFKGQMKNSYDPDAIVDAYKKEYVANRAGLAVQGAVSLANAGHISPEQAAAIARDTVNMQEEYSGVKGTERIFAEQMAPLDMPEFLYESQVATNTAWATYQKWADEQGTWDDTKSWLGAFFVPDTLKDASDLTGSGFLSGKEGLTKFIAEYNAVDPRLRGEYFELVFPDIVEAYDGNYLKIAGLIATMHGTNPDTDIALGAISDTFDVATSASLASLVGIVKGLTHGINNVRKAKKLDNALKAKAMEDIDPVASGTTAKAATSSPFDLEDHIPFFDSTDGLSKEAIELADKIRQDIKTNVTDPARVVGGKNFTIQSEPLSKIQMTKQSELYVEDLAEQADEVGVLFEQVSPISANADGFTVKYKWGDEVVEDVRKWKESDVGSFIEEGSDYLANGWIRHTFKAVLSPDLVLESLSKNLVQKLTNAGLQSERIKNNLIKIHRSINDGLSSREIAAVDELIMAGDEAETVYKLDDLLSGNVQVKSGMREYSIKEATNYYKKRALADEMHAFRDSQIKAELEFQGARNVSFINDSNKPANLIGIPSKSLRATLLNVDKDADIFIPKSVGVNEVTKAKNVDAAKMEEDGYVIYKLATPYEVEKGVVVKHALIKEDGAGGAISVGNLPDQVLNKVPGYVARTYRPGYWFVKDIKNADTVRAFERKTDAMAFARAENAVNADRQVDVFGDRDFSGMDALIEDANFFGGLYHSPRKKTAPLMVQKANGELARPERISYNDSMNRYITNLSNEMGLGIYRMSMKQQFINTVNELAAAEKKSFGLDPRADWKKAPILITDDAIRGQLEYTRDYLINQLRIPSSDERKWTKYMQGVSAVAEGKLGKVGELTARGAMNIASKDPISAMRAATFHLHLGWFNMRQLYIQAQNAAIAVSMHPIHGMAAATDMIPMRAMLNMSDEALDAIKASNKFGLGSYVDDVKAFNRSGMKDSILRTADYDSAADGLGTITRKSFKAMAQKGLTFYEEGELAARLMSWNIAKRNKGLKGALTDDQINDLLDETFRLHMNLQRENAAKWQQNILAIPLQFMQAQAKFAENIMTGLAGKGKWTQQEAASAFAGQILMYGVLGVPIAEDAAEWMMDAFDITPEEFQQRYPNFAEGITDGAVGVLGQVIGLDNQFGGDTASLLAGLDDNTVAAIVSGAYQMFSGEFSSESIGDLAFGPTANTFKRGGDLIGNMVTTLKSLIARPTFENVGEGLLKTVDDFTALTSTWSNARKTREMFRMKQIMTKQGKVMIGENQIDGLSFMTKVIAGLGLPTDIEASYWSMNLKNRDYSTDMSSKKREVLEALVEGVNSGDFERYRGILAWHSLAMDPIEYREMMIDINRQALSGSTELGTQYKRSMDNLIRSGGNAGSGLGVMNIIDARDK